jgi:hypothetical protein
MKARFFESYFIIIVYFAIPLHVSALSVTRIIHKRHIPAIFTAAHQLFYQRQPRHSPP